MVVLTTDQLTTDQRGAATELAIALAAAQLGVGVSRPVTEGERYDLIFNIRPRLVRVQCKSAVLHYPILKVPCYSARRSARGFVKRPYSASEIDAIAAYSPELCRCFFIPIEEIPGRSYLQLRLEPCLNNQRSGVNWADDFDLAARLTALLGP